MLGGLRHFVYSVKHPLWHIQQTQLDCNHRNSMIKTQDRNRNKEAAIG
jgi:hypothetical protein